MELFDTTGLRAAERLRRMDAEQVPGQISLDAALADTDSPPTGTMCDTGFEPVMPASPVELFSVDEARGQLVLS